jgi:sortase (surface protein transpeptidase)
VGHRDSSYGPAVFYGLGELTHGDPIVVADENGRHRTFVITAVEDVEKDDFPTERVYGGTGAAQLRLLTCSGSFEGDEYENNLIVYADMRSEVG